MTKMTFFFGTPNSLQCGSTNTKHHAIAPTSITNTMTTTTTTTTLLFVYSAVVLLATNGCDASSLDFRIENAMPRGNILDLTLRSRITLPYGPDLYQRDPPQANDEQPYQGYGMGLGACESIRFDPRQKYLYSMSDVGYIIITDYADPAHPKLTEYSFAARHDDLGSIAICPDAGMLFVSLTDENKVDVYSLVDREDPKVPTLLRSFEDISQPKTILISADCDTLVAANDNPGEDLKQGSVTIFRNLLQGTTTSSEAGDEQSSSQVDITRIPLDYDEWDDKYLLRRGLNMPLTYNAIEYWDDHSDIADEIDFTELRQNYRPSIFLEPANLAWNGPSEEELLVNLQENNGLLRINMTDLTPVAVAGYGLKDHSVVPIDINAEDGTCDLKRYPSLFAMRNPDIIQTVKYNDKYYVITANEGGGKEYEDWEEEVESNDLFKGNEFGLKNVIIPKHLFDPNNTMAGHSALFNDACGENEEDSSACLNEITMSVGSVAVDYESDPANPIFHRMVLFGGRGWSIYELPEDPDDLLKLVFDSADAMEKDGCEHFPWSHNAVQDDEFAPVTGPNNTFFKYLDGDEDQEGVIEKNDPEEDGCEDQGDGTPGACPMPAMVDEESGGTGPSIENVIIGQACGRLVAAVAAEKNSVAMLFDITDITSPDLVKVFHLSPGSQFKSVGLLYDEGELGEIDPESGIFVSAEDSPSGKAGILWAGAKSGTVAFWEFECKEESTAPTADQAKESTSSGTMRHSWSSWWWTTTTLMLLTSVFAIIC